MLTAFQKKVVGLIAGFSGVGAVIVLMGVVKWGHPSSMDTPPGPRGEFDKTGKPRPSAPALPKAPYVSSSEGLPVGGEWRGKPTVGDLNKDGLLDIVCSVRKGDGLFAFLNEGGGKRWKEAISGLPRNAGYGGVAIGDINRDGFADIVFSTHGNPIQVYAGDGNGSWTRHCKGLANTEIASDVAIGDVDNDGDLDVVSVAWASGGLFYYENQNGETWKTTQIFPKDKQMFGKAIELADMNLDGNLDIVATYFGPKVFLGDGKGHFSDPTETSKGLVEPLTGGVFQGLAVKDLDGDGRPEIIATSMAIEGLQGVTAWKWSDTESRWLEFDKGLPRGETLHGVDAGDLDHDGHADIVLSSEHGVLIYYGDGTGNFSRGEQIEGSSHTAEIRIADFNGDGLGDILEVYCFRPGGVRVWMRQPSGQPKK